MDERAVITAKIPAEYRDKLKKHGVNVNRLINEAVAQEIHRLEQQEYQKLVDEASKILKKLPEKHLVALIRSSRDER